MSRRVTPLNGLPPPPPCKQALRIMLEFSYIELGLLPYYRELKQRLRKYELKMCFRAALNFITLIPSRSIHQLLADFSGVEF